jgi:hypothetical protein
MGPTWAATQQGSWAGMQRSDGIRGEWPDQDEPPPARRRPGATPRWPGERRREWGWGEDRSAVCLSLDECILAIFKKLTGTI